MPAKQERGPSGKCRQRHRDDASGICGVEHRTRRSRPARGCVDVADPDRTGLEADLAEADHARLVQPERRLEVLDGVLGERADEVSRWILAEASPLALPDARWDKMVYGVRDCEEFLRAIQ